MGTDTIDEDDMGGGTRDGIGKKRALSTTTARSLHSLRGR